eukprot:15345985-Ditylum_brightwellii.AAC.1
MFGESIKSGHNNRAQQHGNGFKKCKLTCMMVSNGDKFTKCTASGGGHHTLDLCDLERDRAFQGDKYMTNGPDMGFKGEECMVRMHRRSQADSNSMTKLNARKTHWHVFGHAAVVVNDN